MAAILQFWTDEASVADGKLFRGRTYPFSTLAEYIMNAVNPVLPPGYKVTWDHVITHTPWMKKQLFNFTSEEEWKMRHQAIPVAGISSDLEVAMEMCYKQHIMDMAAQQKKKEQQEKPGQKATPSSKPTEVSHSGYDVNLIRHSSDTTPGSTSPVTAQENQLLDEDVGLTRAPGTSRPGTEENPG